MDKWQSLMELARAETEPKWRHSNPLTYHGHEFSVIKSGVQKEIRRGHVDNALALAVEADASFVGIKGAKANRTNLVNRLLLIASEDICLAVPGLPALMLKWYESYLSAAANASSPSSVSNLRDRLMDLYTTHKPVDACVEAWAAQRAAMVRMVRMLALAPKSRMLSDIAAVYIKPYKVAYARRWHPELFEAWDPESEAYKKLKADSGFYAVSCGFGAWMQKWLWKLKAKFGIGPEGREHLKRLFVFVEMKHDLAFMALKQYILDPSNQPMKSAPVVWHGKKRAAKGMVFMVWNMMEDYAHKFVPLGPCESQIKALAQIYDLRKSNKESWLFVAHGLAFLVWRDKWPKVPSSGYDPESLCSYDNDDARMYDLYSKVIQGASSPTIKPYFIDKHTRQGKRAYGKGRAAAARFATEGAIVSNEVQCLVDPVYHRLYVAGSLNYQPLQKRVKTVTKTGKERNKTVEEPAIDMQVSPLVDQWMQFVKPVNAKHLPESELFSHAVRAQLLTGKNRPDVYYAQCQGRPVVCKGPYLPHQIEALRSAVYMMHVKTHYKGLLPIRCQVIYAVPTPLEKMSERSRNPPGFGSRCKIEPNQAYPFLVMDDIARPPGLKQYPVTTRSSKCWPETEIADLSKSLGASPKWSSQAFSGPQPCNSPHAQAQLNYILATLGGYIWQVTDTCAGNFVWIKSTGQVYRVDEENFHHPKQLGHIYKKPMPPKAKVPYMRALKQHWGAVSQAVSAWKQLEAPVQPSWVRENLDRIDAIEKIENLL